MTILDSASARLSKTVFAAFRPAGLKYAVIPGALAACVQAIGGALAAMHRAERQSVYIKFMENTNVLTAAQYRNEVVGSAYTVWWCVCR